MLCGKLVHDKMTNLLGKTFKFYLFILCFAKKIDLTPVLDIRSKPEGRRTVLADISIFTSVLLELQAWVLHGSFIIR